MFKSLLSICLLLFYANCQFNGIDVSVWQGPNIDFQAVKNSGINFVILRAGYGRGTVDDYFEINYQKAKAAGLNVGVYWYSYAESYDDSTSEANAVLSVMKGKQFEYPIYYDIEERSIFDKGVDFTSGIAKNFCTILESNKYYCGIYASLNFLKNYFNYEVKHKYTVWVAQYNSECTYDEPYAIWQRSSKGNVPGIDGNVDLDISYEDFPPIMKEFHLNGF